MTLSTIFQSSWRTLKRENLHYAIIATIVSLGLSSIAISIVEPEFSLLDGIWWSIVTVTTVGYGDISPSSIPGQIIAVYLMFFSVFILAFIGAVIASVLVDTKIKKDLGMKSHKVTEHIIICEWNARAEGIVREFRADSQTADTPIVLVADNIDHKPIDDEDFHFIRGNINEKSLRQAGLFDAHTVVILGDDTLEPTARDGKVVMTTLTVKHINRDAYTIVELADKNNLRHVELANADEIIISSELAVGLISQAALDHGIGRVVSEMLRKDEGNELYRIPIPPHLVGHKFIDVFTKMMQEYQATVLAVQKNGATTATTNPPLDYQLNGQDHLVIVAEDRPVIY